MGAALNRAGWVIAVAVAAYGAGRWGAKYHVVFGPGEHEHPEPPPSPFPPGGVTMTRMSPQEFFESMQQQGQRRPPPQHNDDGAYL